MGDIVLDCGHAVGVFPRRAPCVECATEPLHAQLAAAEKQARERDAELALAVAALKAAEAQRDALQRFKDFVHRRLDAAGVPHDPDPEHNKQHGCRVQGRLTWLETRAQDAEAAVVTLRTECDEARTEIERLQREHLDALDLIDRFKEAPGINVGGDPGGITPEHVTKLVQRLDEIRRCADSDSDEASFSLGGLLDAFRRDYPEEP